MKLTLPELSLVVLVGISGSGKSSFAARHFREPEVLSSDACRALVSNDENALAATGDAFDVLRFIAAKRLARKLLTVVDATSVQRDDRKPLVDLARAHHVVPVAIVLDLPLSLCKQRNREREDRNLPTRVLQRQHNELRRSLCGLKREGFRYVYTLSAPEEVDAVDIERAPAWTDRSHDHGPFDIIGDVHGCFDELVDLLERLGYAVELGDSGLADRHRARHPEGRKAVFVGDLVDRGPKTPDVLRLVMGMVEAGTALCVPGNHDDKLKRALQGRDVTVAHGLAESLAQLAGCSQEFRAHVAAFLDGLVSHYVLDDGTLVVAHAGMTEDLAGRASRKVRDFAMYGETTGETDEFGLPIRYRWAADYRGSAAVVYGHTPVPEPEWLNETINIDTGCVFGGALTALRWPERQLCSAPARRTYYEPVRPLAVAGDSGGRVAQHDHGALLDIDDLLGKRLISTELMGAVTVREDEGAAALETISRFAVDPRWLIYLPPTMAPAGTAADGDLLEHPELAWQFFARAGVQKLVCEEKHMGSRAVIVVSRAPDAARARFGVTDGRSGIIYTRTGRLFFDDRQVEDAVLSDLSAAIARAGIWDDLGTDWLCLDAEILPWNLKAGELIREHFAAVAAAGRGALPAVEQALALVARRSVEAAPVRDRMAERAAAVERFAAVYQAYCWEVAEPWDVRVAPFHLLASEGQVHHRTDHGWHLEMVRRLADAGSESVILTPSLQVDLDEPDSMDAATAWWAQRTDAGAEGMVVKPWDFTVRGRRGLVQPAVKVRGRQYLRIIYGPEYALPANLERLRDRSLGRKRSLALREYALGIEGLQRFVSRRPLREVHECSFGVLALDSDPIDPRL